MTTDAELIVDRRRLKRRVTFWRIAAVVLAVAGGWMLEQTVVYAQRSFDRIPEATRGGQ